jgi:hypothetical protein
MKTKVFSTALFFFLGMVLLTAGYRCSGTRQTTGNGQMETIMTNVDGQGISIQLEFIKGAKHNHPLIAIWIEDPDGNYIETLYIAESIGTGIFRHGEITDGKWQEGPVRRPAALPYWGHKRGVKARDGLFIPTPDDPMPDAVTGPTPKGNFILKSKTSTPDPAVLKLVLEINQSWDWNDYWTNTKYPDDVNYKTSSQPAVVYEALIDLSTDQKEYIMAPVGHSHYSGYDGSLNPNLETLTTALEIVKSIKVAVIL